MKKMMILTLALLSLSGFASESCSWDVNLSCNGEDILRSCNISCADGRQTFSGYEVLTSVACAEPRCEYDRVIDGTCACVYEKQD